MSDKNYNIWYTQYSRWVQDTFRTVRQNPGSPLKLSLEDAKEWHRNFGDPIVFVIRELLADGITGGEFYNEEAVAVPIHNSTATAVNDHVCPICQNDRCNKQEKFCWKCGSTL